MKHLDYHSYMHVGSNSYGHKLLLNAFLYTDFKNFFNPTFTSFIFMFLVVTFAVPAVSIVILKSSFLIASTTIGQGWETSRNPN